VKGRKRRKILIMGLDIGKKIKVKENMRREDGVKEWIKNKLEIDYSDNQREWKNSNGKSRK